MFAISGLTGSSLVFYQDIDEQLNPSLLTVVPDSEYAPLATIVAAAKRVAPAGAEPARLYLPRHSRAAMRLRFTVPRDGRDILNDVFVNPYTAKVLGQREWDNSLMGFLYKLHYTLALGDTGEMIIGVTGLFLMMVLLSGFVLWWPKRGKFFQALTFKRSANHLRFIYELHKTIGAYAAVVLLVIAFCGVYMIFPHYVKPLIGSVLPFTKTLPVKSVTVDKQREKRIDIDDIANIAKAVFPQAELRRIYFPTSAEDIYRVIMRQTGEVRKTSGSTQLWIDRYAGEVVSMQTPKNMRSGDSFVSWLFPLHNGEAFGLAGRVIVFLAGFTPIILYVTGLMFWWRKRSN